ncbi:MAG: PD-(D/E)XK nuclease family protein, partial [Spirochaetaceae bacterium]|nr:PD-(D/E)XK nuclease family protein [Spirochaetaceae bacterium]
IKNSKDTGVKSFLDLLEPALNNDGTAAFFSQQEIEPVTRAEVRATAAVYNAAALKKKSMREKTENAAEKYALAAQVEAPEIFIVTRQASRLHEGGLEKNASAFPPRIAETGGKFFDDLALTPAAFGVLVHSVIEKRYEGAEQNTKDFAEQLADMFFASDIGKKSLQADFRKTEYPILCLREEDGKKIYVSGVMDLLFEFENEMYVVDYKTDRVINPEKYREQLAVYVRAAEDLFCKKARGFLFYLREGAVVAL